MNVKRKSREAEAVQLSGLSSKEMAERCPDLRKVFPGTPCLNSLCEWGIKDDRYMNCSFVAAQAHAESKHGMTLDEIGRAMGLSAQAVQKIEQGAMVRLLDRLRALDHGPAPIPEQSLVPRNRRVQPCADDDGVREEVGNVLHLPR